MAAVFILLSSDSEDPGRVKVEGGRNHSGQGILEGQGQVVNTAQGMESPGPRVRTRI